MIFLVFYLFFGWYFITQNLTHNVVLGAWEISRFLTATDAIFVDYLRKKPN